MTPSTTRMPPPSLAGLQLFASPVPRPPTTMGAAGPPPPPRPPPRPPPKPPAAPAGGVPVGPQPVVRVVTHLRLRFLTVFVLTSFSALKRFPLRSPDELVH